MKNTKYIKPFNRNFYSKEDDFTFIGSGELGGKAGGLAFIKEKIVSQFSKGLPPGFIVNIPRLTVITTHYFDRFMEMNNLYPIALSDLSDDRLAHYFLKAQLPAELNGDLWALITNIHAPLAVRSSSLLEDSLKSPFAGVYETKMIPNNQPDIKTRFHKLIEAIKFVYASTFFANAKSYIKNTSYHLKDEKMAVIIQEVVGIRHYNRYYPNISGVARSYNFYPTGHSKPEDGVVNLALGLGKTIVDGGQTWTYSPEYPEQSPPFGSIKDMLKQTQLEFWAVNMGNLASYDPVKESEFLSKFSLAEAEYDNTLLKIASTYDYESDRINIGTNTKGPRIINFAPILELGTIPVNEVIKSVLECCEQTLDAKVEIEFALTIEPGKEGQIRFGLLQVRPMAVSQEEVDIEIDRFKSEILLTASGNVMGNGIRNDLQEVVYVVPETFQLKESRKIAAEINLINRHMVESKVPYVLIGFGRWGSSDPWLGIPVEWGKISGCRVIIETQLPGISIDLSQGSHFFHNLVNLGVFYFSIEQNTNYPIDWNWLSEQDLIEETPHIRRVRLKAPLSIMVDGRKPFGVILK